ncbi:hypothetical protein D5125_17305 [Magnetovirga frankeli]|uniref:hypothetical protein n=1 Tax=Magnetovirga frankeli TaxID=947516 RepID=UPI0012937532|nr:hypothetical protein D5125_17305 [gamma proteobacterium SS-5]
MSSRRDHFIQGAPVWQGREQRVYVVTIDPPPEQAPLHVRWPRLVSVVDAVAVSHQP